MNEPCELSICIGSINTFCVEIIEILYSCIHYNILLKTELKKIGSRSKIIRNYRTLSGLARGNCASPPLEVQMAVHLQKDKSN